MPREVQLAVEGMTCGHCQAAVQRSLDALPGVSDVTVSLEDARATAQISDHVSVADLIGAVDAAGYAAAQEGT